jgi:hypothetical protein
VKILAITWFTSGNISLYYASQPLFFTPRFKRGDFCLIAFFKEMLNKTAIQTKITTFKTWCEK